LAEASRNPHVAAVLREADAARLGRIEKLFETAWRQRGVAANALTLRQRATALMTLLDGLLLRAVREPNMDKLALKATVHQVTHALLEV
jgi:hypothetical protein